MKSLSLLPLFLALSASTAIAAPPSGTFVFKMKNPQANGTVTLSVAGGNVRSEMEMSAKGMGPMKMTMLMKASNPKKGYMIDAQQKTYAEVDTGAGRGGGKPQKFKAKKIGNETVGKWKTIHVELVDEKGEKAEIWTTQEIDLGRSLFDLLGQAGPSDDGMMKALESVGAQGFPVKMVSAKNEGVSLELIKHDPSAPAAALFEIPADYKKSGAGAVMGGALPPEAQKQLQDAMKNMTPEQREAMERAMRGAQGGGGGDEE